MLWIIKLWLTVVVLTCHIKCFYWIPRPMTGAYSLTSNDKGQFTTAGTFCKFTEGIRTNNVTFFPGESPSLISLQTCIFFHDGNLMSCFMFCKPPSEGWGPHDAILLQIYLGNAFFFFFKWCHLYDIREKSPATRGKTGGRVIINLESDFMINSHNLNLRKWQTDAFFSCIFILRIVSTNSNLTKKLGLITKT